MYTKIIFDKTGSILGKIPIKRTRPNCCHNNNSSAGRNHRCSRGSQNFIESIESKYNQDMGDRKPSRYRAAVQAPLRDLCDEDSNQGCYFPLPIPSFLFEEPMIRCLMCHEQLSIDAAPETRNSACILPCGHVGCYSCMTRWIKENKNCPVCRFKTIHPGCGHPCNIMPINYGTVIFLPKTIPMGGKVNEKCRWCQEEDDITIIMKVLRDAERELLDAHRDTKIPLELKMCEIEDTIKNHCAAYQSNVTSFTW